MLPFVVFSPLTRQDLVAWKVALHHRSLPAISKEVIPALVSTSFERTSAVHSLASSEWLPLFSKAANI